MFVAADGSGSIHAARLLCCMFSFSHITESELCIGILLLEVVADAGDGAAASNPGDGDVDLYEVLAGGESDEVHQRTQPPVCHASMAYSQLRSRILLEVATFTHGTSIVCA